MQPANAIALPKQMPRAGIYLFSEGQRHLYVGRSNSIRRRIQEQGRPSSGHNTAPLAFLLAREETGHDRASYAPKGSRSELESNPAFKAAFKRAKERIRRMDVRYVEEGDPIRQALLEIYAAVALETAYNDFDTH